jgi:hypothetical protein
VDLTIMLWAHIHHGGPFDPPKGVLLSKGAGGTGYALAYEPATEHLVLTLNADDGRAWTFALEAPVFDQDWHSIALVLARGDTPRVIVDGDDVQQADLGTVPDIPLQSDLPLTLGALGGSHHMMGHLDEVRFVGRAVALCEVRSLAYFPYDDGIAEGVDPFMIPGPLQGAAEDVCALADFPSPLPPLPIEPGSSDA